MGRTTVEPRLLAQKPRFQLFTTYSGKSNYFLTRELRACARASYKYDVGNGIRSIGRFL